VLSELAPASGDSAGVERAFEVQAVLARTYGVANLKRHVADGFDVCDTTHCQVVELGRPETSRWATIARRAVDSTRGMIVTFKGGPASVLFHSDCGGARSSAAEVWGGNGQPYLAGGPDPLPQGAAHVTWHYVIARQRLQRALNSRPTTSVGDRLDTIDVQSRDSARRARLVLLNGERAPLVRGEDLRAVLNAALGPAAIRSARFDVRRDGDRFVFDGQGFGHGVGLCQTGALARAAAGQSVDAILQFYFPGTRLNVYR
jgi:stage II sporulation protein D